MSLILFSIMIGLLILLFASGMIQQKTLDKWTHDTGRAPMIHRGRGSWYAYLRSVQTELPPSISKRIAIWGWIGRIAVILMWVVVAFGAVWHRH